jgi:hypothetical protein
MFVFCSLESSRARQISPVFRTCGVSVLRTYDVLRQSSAGCKALKVLKSCVLKRLASAVQLRPWPPSFYIATPVRCFGDGRRTADFTSWERQFFFNVLCFFWRRVFEGAASSQR